LRGSLQRICDALRAAGLEVWFDQSEPRGGDAWDAAIRKQPEYLERLVDGWRKAGLEMAPAPR
jgi:hypothetical protein